MNDLKKHYFKEPYEKDGYTWYEANFPNQHSLYNYLKSNPTINREVFAKRASLSNDTDFHGEKLDTALEYLIKGNYPNCGQFLKLQRELSANIVSKAHTAKFVKGPVGSRIHLPNAVAGSPNFMVRPVYEEEVKFVTFHFCLSYNCRTTAKEVENRGLIALYLIKLLESYGYRVKLNSFELSSEGDELVYIKTILKRFGLPLDISSCYFPFVAIEFLRRNYFYCLETMDVKNGWQSGYGCTVHMGPARKLLGIPEKDIFFGQPEEMGITEDLYSSIDNVLEAIKFEKYVKVKKIER